mmetsp:Transcript_25013/g.70335  ORF Transcript_25013/g.70335 Transcript_25013/m.70335 type:complete len:229 (+) Transcript_25013:749-1435(+)
MMRGFCVRTRSSRAATSFALSDTSLSISRRCSSPWRARSCNLALSLSIFSSCSFFRSSNLSILFKISFSSCFRFPAASSDAFRSSSAYCFSRSRRFASASSSNRLLSSSASRSSASRFSRASSAFLAASRRASSSAFSASRRFCPISFFVSAQAFGSSIPKVSHSRTTSSRGSPSTGDTTRSYLCLNVCKASMFARYSVSLLCASMRNLPLKPMASGLPMGSISSDNR